jgi:hypothetical protein
VKLKLLALSISLNLAQLAFTVKLGKILLLAQMELGALRVLQPCFRQQETSPLHNLAEMVYVVKLLLIVL